MRINNYLALLLSILSLLIFPLIFPTFGLVYFAPYLALSLYRPPLFLTFWKAVCAGLILDLFTSDIHFGATAIIYCLVTLILIRAKNYLFQDKWTTMPILTSLISLLTTLFSGVATLFFEHVHTFPSIAELLLATFYNSLYSIIVFVLPFQIYRRIGKLRARKIRESG